MNHLIKALNAKNIELTETKSKKKDENFVWKFTDITLTFPGSAITYDAHCLILAISSPVFEGILYGLMRPEGPNILLHDDDPLVMKDLIAHCYGEDIEPSDMDTALELYKLADKYLLDELQNVHAP